MNTYTPPPTALDDPIKKLRAIIKNLTREEKDAHTGKRNRTPPDERLRIVNELLASDVAEPLSQVNEVVLGYCSLSIGQQKKKSRRDTMERYTNILESLADYLIFWDPNASRRQATQSKQARRAKTKHDVAAPSAVTSLEEKFSDGHIPLMAKIAFSAFKGIPYSAKFQEQGYEQVDTDMSFIGTLTDKEHGLYHCLMLGYGQEAAAEQMGVSRQNIRTLRERLRRKYVNYIKNLGQDEYGKIGSLSRNKNFMEKYV